MSEDRVFLDTNIIIYAYDISAVTKHEIANELLINLWDQGLAVISTQVLQEFFVNVTQKIPEPLDIKIARDIINDLLKWDVVVNDGESILNAIEIHRKYKYSFWDSMIIDAAIKGRCTILLSEDLLAGQKINSVEIKNPFLIEKHKA